MTPTDHYSERLAAREAVKARLDVLHARLGSARLLFAALALGALWASGQHGTDAAWIALPAGLFVAAVLYHQRVRTQRELAARSVAFYHSGLQRLRGEPQHREANGARFADAHHIYADDLDIFGKDSLFECLCSARTPMGEDTLARWLSTPADLPTLKARHACVDELRTRIELREDLQVLGIPARIVLHTDAITTWAKAPNKLLNPGLRVGAGLLAAAAIAGVMAWTRWGLMFPLLAVLAIEAGLSYWCRTRVHAAVAGVEQAYEQIKLLATLLRRIESETFTAPRLLALQRHLASHSTTASLTLNKLATIVNFVEARRNPLLAPVLLSLMYVIQSAIAAERWRQRHGAAVAAWLEVLGEFEALESIASYAFEHPQDCVPEFLSGPATFSAQALGHPLLAPSTRVCNDVELSGGVRVLLVSGSNMSGKSTLLRSVGVNTVMAMAGAPVCATRLCLTPLQVGASIRINDSLHEGSSRFYAEITRLRQLFDTPLGTVGPSLIFLLDELLQGTNSTDRRVGAQGVVRALLARGAIGLVSTHDLALADDADLRQGALKNVHFDDELVDAELSFDFKLRDGAVTKSNGVALMRAIGLDV